MKYYKTSIVVNDILKDIAPWHVVAGAPGFPKKPLWETNEFKAEKVTLEKSVLNGIDFVRGITGQDSIKLDFNRVSNNEAYVAFMKNDVELARITEILSPGKKIKVTFHSDQDINADLIINGEYDDSNNEVILKTEFNNKIFSEKLKGGEHQIPKIVYDVQKEIESYNPNIKIDFTHEMIYPIIGELFNTDKPYCDVSPRDWILCGVASVLTDVVVGMLTGGCAGAAGATLIVFLLNLMIIMMPKNYA